MQVRLSSQIAPPCPKLTPVALSGRHAGAAEREDERPQRHHPVSVVFPGRDQDRVSGSYDKTIKVWDMVKWSRKDHLMFNDTTQRFVLLLLWLNKCRMKFPDDVLDLLIGACLQSK
jgi:hypothetical protein